ncbi:MAG: anti-sigma factor family protein, partial [Planctomycetia bacterium]
MNHDRRDPPIAPDDPRLSEWLDGRLPAAEAAEIERIVAASPELTRLVEDLRGMRGALAAVPTTPPPAGFVRDVLAAIDVAGDGAAEEAEVEAEWRRIERQRLEGEIAEARDDAAEPAPEPMRQRWPWIALAGALAAGVLVAVVIDRPRGPADREVALVEQQAARRQANEAAESAKQALEPRVADKWLEETQEASEKLAAAAAAPAREQAAEAAAVAEP